MHKKKTLLLHRLIRNSMPVIDFKVPKKYISRSIKKKKKLLRLEKDKMNQSSNSNYFMTAQYRSVLNHVLT
jgi:hypothetical protein